MKGSYTKVLNAGLAGAALMAAGAAHAEESWFEKLFGGIGVGGFIQLETAFRTTGEENPNNQRGNVFNGRPVNRVGQAAIVSNALDQTGVNDALALVNTVLGTLPAVPGLGQLAIPAVGIQDTYTREVQQANNSFNLSIVRTEVDLEWPILSNVRLKATARGIFDVDRYDNFDDDQFSDGGLLGLQAPIPGDAVGRLQNANGVNFFEYRYDSNTPARFDALDQTNAQVVDGLQGEKGSSPLEFAGQDYLVDFPNLYLDIEFGPLLLRVGNQQIAWGDAIFFRILDVPNALDLRRHSVLDFVAEEFSDKRVPALGIRASLTAASPFFFLGVSDWEYDAFVQRFRSTILGNPNTPYNVVPAQFTVHDRFKSVDNEYNFGIRVKGPLGPVDVQFIAARLYNPAGVFHWQISGVEEDAQSLPAGTGTTGLIPPPARADGQPDFDDPTVGPADNGGGLSRTVFEVDPTGVTSGEEFSFYGGIARLDHANGLNEIIQNFPAARGLLASRAESNEAQLRQEDLFLQLTGGLRGHVARSYFRENNFGMGITHNFSGPPGSLIDQLIGSIEVKYVPDRVYTPIDLSPQREEFIQEDEIEAALVFTKFQRFSQSFPATFLVLQYLYRSESDLFGRHLSGYGGGLNGFQGNANFDDDLGSDDPDAFNRSRNDYQAMAFAFQQPFPNRIFVADFALLWDIEGGLLVQPSLTWKPNREIKVQGFYNFIDTVYGEENNNAISTASFADEFTLRLSYQF